MGTLAFHQVQHLVDGLTAALQHHPYSLVLDESHAAQQSSAGKSLITDGA